MRRVVALVASMLLGSCGNQPTAGGGSDQPNSLDVLVVRADGSSLATGAAARWVSGSWNPQDTVTQLDSIVYGPQGRVGDDGRLRIPRPDSGVWHLEIIDSSSRQIGILNAVGSYARLEQVARWAGVLTGQGAPPGSLGLVGTSRRARLGPDRTFVLDWLPAGTYRVLGAWSSRHRELAIRRFESGQDVSNDTLDGDSAETALIDLERFPLRCALRGRFWPEPDTSKGKWFALSDTTSSIEPSAVASNPQSALRTDEGRRYMRWDVQLGGKPYFVNGAYQYPWAAIGLQVAPDNYGLDWRNVSAVQILARGRGLFRFQLNTRKVEEISPWGHFGQWVGLDSVWRWIDIPVAQLRPEGLAEAKGYGWADAASGVQSIRFLASGSASRLELADIRVRGAIGSRVP